VHHMNGFGPDAVHALGKSGFQAKFKVDFEAVIARLNAEWTK
jgi:hypothetical protein